MTKPQIFLKAEWHGEVCELSISEWSKATGIDRKYIDKRHMERMKGKSCFTDAEIIFGRSNLNIIEDAFKKFCFSKSNRILT